MRRSKDEFHAMLNNTTELAKHLTIVFPDPRDAVMSLGLILVGLAKSIEMPRDVLLALIAAIDKDMHEMDDEQEHTIQ